jgi:putative SOS response-associated peptidase YedK
MCNLYSLTKGPQAIRDFARARLGDVGDMPPLPGVFPDYLAPILRNASDGRELVMARWGMPSPLFALKGRKSDPGVTNIRNVASPHWPRWLGVESRCVVPLASFSEKEILPDGSRPPVWFAFDETRPLAFFAGLWPRWTSVRKVKEGEMTNDLFGFPATEPRAEVQVIHPTDMRIRVCCTVAKSLATLCGDLIRGLRHRRVPALGNPLADPIGIVCWVKMRVVSSHIERSRGVARELRHGHDAGRYERRRRLDARVNDGLKVIGPIAMPDEE